MYLCWSAVKHISSKPEPLSWSATQLYRSCRVLTGSSSWWRKAQRALLSWQALPTPISILFIPLGFGVWQLAAAAVTGFIAKENVVGTLAVVYGVTNLIDTDELALVGSGSDVATIMGLTKAAALAYLMFNLYTSALFSLLWEP